MATRRGNINFLQWSVTGNTKHTPGKVPCSGGVNKLKSDSLSCSKKRRNVVLCSREMPKELRGGKRM